VFIASFAVYGSVKANVLQLVAACRSITERSAQIEKASSELYFSKNDSCGYLKSKFPKITQSIFELSEFWSEFQLSIAIICRNAL